MSRFRVGQMVRLISHVPEDYPPPIGAVGTVVREADEYGDYAVLFHAYPWNPFVGFHMNNPQESNDWEVQGCQLAPAVGVQDLERCTENC